MAGFFGGVFQIVLAVILVTTVLIPTLKGVNQSSWTAGEIAIFSLATLVSIGGLVNGIANVFGLGF